MRPVYIIIGTKDIRTVLQDILSEFTTNKTMWIWDVNKGHTEYVYEIINGEEVIHKTECGIMEPTCHLYDITIILYMSVNDTILTHIPSSEGIYSQWDNEWKYYDTKTLTYDEILDIQYPPNSIRSTNLTLEDVL